MTQLGLFSGVPRDALAYLATDGKTPNTAFNRANLLATALTDSGGDAANVALTTQVMTSVPIFLAAGEVVTNISARSGQTAVATPTNYWFALYDNAATPNLLAQTADQTTAAWAANSTKTLALSAPVTIRTSGVYWVGLHVKATTVPSLLGAIVRPAIVTGERSLAQASGSALVAAAPATIATPTAQNFAPYVVLT